MSIQMTEIIKNKILSIVNKYPKHYNRMLIKDAELHNWILENSYETTNFAERVYVSLYSPPNKTQCGKYPKFNTFFKGFFEFCGTKSVCNCARLDHSLQIVDVSKNKTVTEKQEILEKYKTTMLEKYGVENAMHSDDILEKYKANNNKKYGVDYPLQSTEIQNKARSTIIEKYGVDYMTNVRESGYAMFSGNPFQDATIQEKIKQTNITRYGVSHIRQKHFTSETLRIVQDKNLFCDFIKDKSVREITGELGVEETTVYRLIKQYDADSLYRKRGPSYLESEMAAFLDSIGVTYEANNRTVLGGKELDFYIPSFNLAIEMNGVYWHSDKVILEKKYHYNKWKVCDDNNIHLVSVFEDDWNLQPEKIKSMLLTFFNKKPSGIAARKTTVKEIGANLARPFLEKYHLQGFVGGTHYGAYDATDNLVAVMTFGYTRNQRFELKRFVMDNYNHPGMFSKIFKYAQRELQFQEVVSFSDNTCFTGNVYRVNGFNFVQIINPDYRYLVNDKRSHKSNFKKDSIKKKFPHMTEFMDNGMTEIQAMDYLNIPKIYDCGKREWVWSKP